MNTKQVEYILELAKTLNFNHAAENLHISQPTMTYQIKAIEEEIGFNIFERSGKGAVLTPAGEQFVITLTALRGVLIRSIQQGRDNSNAYKENIRFILPSRSYINFLPQALRKFEIDYPTTNISLTFDPANGLDSFLKGEQDLTIALKDEVKRYHSVKIHNIYDSHLYIVLPKYNPLALRPVLNISDLEGLKFQVGITGPTAMLSLQNKIIKHSGMQFNICNDFDTALIKVAAGQGIALAPGFANDRSDKYAWVRLDTDEVISCVLCTHASDNRKSLQAFISLLQSYYKENQDFPI